MFYNDFLNKELTSYELSDLSNITTTDDLHELLSRYTPEQYFLIIAADKTYDTLRNILVNRNFKYGYDYFDFTPEMLTYPFDLIYEGCFIGRGSHFPGNIISKISSIGRFTSINCSLKMHGNMPLNFISTAPFNHILNNENMKLYNDLKICDEKNTNQKVKIGNDVYIGANVFINTSRVSEIGDGAIIGAGAVVNHDVEPFSVVAGVPAKKVKMRFNSNEIEVLKKVKWWDWDDITLNENFKYILNPELFFNHFR
jgi:acetyltransferase-like isoleucine patch superfamily enzyme